MSSPTHTHTQNQPRGEQSSQKLSNKEAGLLAQEAKEAGGFDASASGARQTFRLLAAGQAVQPRITGLWLVNLDFPRIDPLYS